MCRASGGGGGEAETTAERASRRAGDESFLVNRLEFPVSCLSASGRRQPETAGGVEPATYYCNRPGSCALCTVCVSSLRLLQSMGAGFHTYVGALMEMK